MNSERMGLQATTPHRILVVDDHPVVRESLSLRISHEPDLHVCASVGTSAEALKALDQEKPDAVVIDMNLPDGHGLELIKEIHARHPSVRMLVFSMHDDRTFGERALRAGAQGYVMKSESPDTVVSGIRRILSGGIVTSAELSARLIASFSPNARATKTPVESLSDRELEVFQLIGQGVATKEIAARLHRSVKTIETYRVRIKNKLKLESPQELVASAARWLAEHEGT